MRHSLGLGDGDQCFKDVKHMSVCCCIQSLNIMATGRELFCFESEEVLHMSRVAPPSSIIDWSSVCETKESDLWGTYNEGVRSKH